MGKKIFSWSKVLPVLGVSLLAAALVSFVGGGSSSAHNNKWGDNDGENRRYYLQLAGVAGDATENGHEGELRLDSYRFLEDEPDAPAEMAAAAEEGPDFGDNNLRFLVDSGKASPMLFAKANTGETLANATLTVVKGTKWDKEYLTYKMTDVVVTSFQTYGNNEKEPLDEVVLSYSTLEVTHNEGSMLKKGWNYKEEKSL
jgi:type VI secretion system Hcp family effector